MSDPGFDNLVTVEVHQATGMVAMQLGCTPLEALGRMIVRTLNEGIALDELARNVIEGTLTFS
jgi:hypothetical protein